MHPLFSGLEVLSYASDKAKLYSKKFSKNSTLDDSGISLLLTVVFDIIARAF